ncbi:amidase [Waterburya agarophytonicola K14]|uniref:Amidase n=1 Tax=Waterburya agarophytonicola KI4 TaxID=2874699 RepID=A0A964BPQ0_9CYAN|nr:amidase [Waterburya agarophytonicola]MCC0177289.1 amidase [Waterburya agarophytonicola KI4]
MPAKNLTDLAFTPALEQAKLIKERQVTPLELIELYLSRIEKYDPQLGSFYYVAKESAIADARQKTEQISQTVDTRYLPPFFGVPIGIKDLKSVANMPITYGIAALKDQIAKYDEGIISKIRQAGFIILGKTATAQLGSFPYTEPEGFAPTRNPWNLDYTPGGSSGGSAAAVAAGLCAIALGGDAGGSIRGPASCCNLVGMKPSRGRISFAPVGDRLSGLGTHGVLARTVADAATFLDVSSGYIVGDPYWLPNPPVSFSNNTQETLPPSKIGFITSLLPLGKPDPQCQEAVNKIVHQLEGMGHEVIPQEIDLSALIEPFTKIWASAVAASGIPPQALSTMNQWVLTQSGTAGEYVQAVTQMQLFARQIVSLFAQIDILIAPTYMHPAIKIREWADLSPQETYQKIVDWIFPCPAFNVTGQPVINIPTGFDRHGIPLGVQLVGKPNNEANIISLASQLEQAQPWSQQRPQAFS